MKQINLNRKKNLSKLQICQLQSKLLEIGITEINGKKNILIERLLSHESFWHRNKPKIKTIVTFLLGAIVSAVIDNFVDLPFNIKQQQEFGKEILQWDQKDNIIRNTARITKPMLDQAYPYGYKIFAKNPYFKLLENDTLFSSLFGVDLEQEVDFDHSKGIVKIEVHEKKVIDKLNINYNQTNNTYSGEYKIPPIGYYIEIGGFQFNDRGLYFGVLDLTPKDEIYIFGYRNRGPVKEHLDYRNSSGRF